MLFQSLLYCSNSCTSLHFKILKSHTKTLKIRPYMFRSALKPSSGGPWPYFARLLNWNVDLHLLWRVVVAHLIKKYFPHHNELHPEEIWYSQRATAEESTLLKCYSVSVLDTFQRILMIFCTRKAIWVHKFYFIFTSLNKLSRSQWPCGLRRRSAAARLLRLRVRIPPGAWMFFCCEFYVCCQIVVSATNWSFTQRSPIDCAASFCVI